MSAGVLLQAVLSGLAAGAVVGLVALGFTVLAATLRVLHLGHGDLAVAAVLTGVLVVLGRTPVAADLDAAQALALVAATLLGGAALGVAVGRFALRPGVADAARGRPADPFGWLLGSLAAGLLLREGLGLLLPREAYAVPDPFGLEDLGGLTLPDGAVLPGRVPVVLAVALGLGLLARTVLVRSRTGRALRAVADDADAALLCGVPAGRVLVVVSAGAGLLAAAAGLLDATAPGRAVQVDDGVLLGLAGAAAAVLGRLGSPGGALLGGLALGVAQGVLAVLPATDRVAVLTPLVVLVVAVCLRPPVEVGRTVR